MNPKARGPGKVEWVEPSRGYGFARKPPTPKYKVPSKPTASYVDRLLVGTIMVTARNLRTASEAHDGYAYPQLVPRGTGTRVTKGTMIVYVGRTWAKERARIDHQAVDINVAKHLFLIPGMGCFIVHDLSNVKHG